MIRSSIIAGRLADAASQYEPSGREETITVLHDMVLAICDAYAMEVGSSRPADKHLPKLFAALDAAVGQGGD